MEGPHFWGSGLSRLRGDGGGDGVGVVKSTSTTAAAAAGAAGVNDIKWCLPRDGNNRKGAFIFNTSFIAPKSQPAAQAAATDLNRAPLLYMRVLKPVGCEDAAGLERRLIAEMLCLEHGARAVGPDGRPLPAPHEPWPTVTLRPVTAGGVACTVHLSPTVGVVYHMLEPGRVAELVTRISSELERAGDAHLCGARAVAATPSTVLRHKGRRIAGRHMIVGPRKCYTKAGDPADDLPTRLLQWTPADDYRLPPHHSIRAAFTWVFMSVGAALAAGEGGFDSMSTVNATVAAILYDGAGISNVPDGEEVSPLGVGHFDAAPLPSALRPFAESQQRPPGVILIDPAGALLYVGHTMNLHLRAGRGVWPPAANVALLPAEAWAPETLASRGGGRWSVWSRDLQCVSCAAPLGGGVVIVRGARTAGPGGHNSCEWRYGGHAPPGTVLVDDGGGVALCVFCWNALKTPACLTAHLDASVAHTVVPYTQAETAAACPEYKALAPLLAGVAAPLAGAPGAFVVTLADGARAVLASKKLGRHPAITNPVIAAAALGVIAEVMIAEVALGGADDDPLA